MSTKFIESCRVINFANSTNIAAAEDMYNGNIASDVVSLGQAQRCVWIITQLANATGNATIFVNACSDVTPSATAAVSFHYREISSADTQGTITESKGFATSTSDNTSYIIEVDASVIQEHGTEFVQLQAVEKTNAAVDGALCGFLFDMRYQEDDPGTQVA